VSSEVRKSRLTPQRLVVLAFGAAIALGTAVLMLPIASAARGSTDLVTAFFTATSAVTITGLAVVDTATYWSFFGQVAILIMIQLGGLGIVSFATLVGLLIAGRISLSNRLNTMTEAKILGVSSIPALLRSIILVYFGFELILAGGLTQRLYFEYDFKFLDALWHGTFHAVSSFNNGGFSTFSDSMVGFAGDMFFIAPIFLAVIVGGLGFPVLLEIHERVWRLGPRPGGRAKRFSLHSRLTLWTSGILVALGTVVIGVLEWSNERTLGALGTWDRIMNAIFASVMTRSGGLNSVDIGEMDEATWIAMDFLMFIGGGSASTAGGIKVTTMAILFFIIYTEIRGEAAVNVGNRRLPRSIQRQALTLVSLSSLVILFSTFVLVATTPFTLDQIIFEVLSAAATVGLSTGITAELPAFAQVWLAVLMFVGRLGPVVIASALALRITQRHYELPKERPLIG
jgi:Trk-type K+ transport system membrane component